MPYPQQVAPGGVLVYPSIHSPNFIHSVSGWTINEDGSAEFQNLTIRGVFDGNDFEINNAGFFLYSGTPALGNLILAIANAAGSDRFGNAYSGPGIAISAPGTGTNNEIQIRPDKNAVLIYAT
jgi:hypothetical protein